MKRFIVFVIVLVIVACQDIKNIQKPDNLIPEQTFEKIVYDINVVNAARGVNVQKLNQFGISPDTYIFEKYTIDSLQYAQSTTFYAADIEKYTALLSRVQKRLESEFSELDAIQKSENKIKDSIRVKRSKEIRKEKDSLNRLKLKDGTLPKNSEFIPSQFKKD